VDTWADTPKAIGASHDYVNASKGKMQCKLRVILHLHKPKQNNTKLHKPNIVFHHNVKCSCGEETCT
jgi:hypothetical protein